MSLFLALGVLLFVLPWNLYWLVVRPAMKRRRAEEPRLPEDFVPPSAALAPPEPRTPRDTSRPYPRPARSRSKLNRVCPVCGMEDPGSLDGKVLGWPAHRSCAEWLGDWRPACPAPPQSGATNTIIFTGKGPVIASGGGAGGSSATAATYWSAAGDRQPLVVLPGSNAIAVSPDAARQMVANGLITLNEAREQIVSVFSVPPPDVGP